MPKIPAGVYTIVLAYNTRSDLGILSSKRKVNIESLSYETLQQRYDAAQKANRPTAMAKASKELLARWKNRRVKPGQICKLETLRFGKKPEAGKLSAAVRWYPGKEGIRVEIDVADATFSINPKALHMGSSISLFFAPSGFDDTRTRFTIAPSGDEDAPLIETDKGGPIKALWKRTEDGYRITASVPYSSIKGHPKGWTLVPVDAIVNSMTPDGRCALMAGAPGQPVDKPGNSSRFYAGLVRK